MSSSKRATRLGYLDFDIAAFDRLPSLIVVVGKEHLLADDAIRSITASISPDESTRALNVDSVDARGAEHFGSVAEKLAALPFLAQRRAVVVRGTIDLKKEARDELARACENVGEHAILIIDHSGKPARPQGRKPAEEAAAFAKLTRDSLVISCTLGERECAAYIDRYAAEINLTIDASARAALAGTEDVSEIKNTLDRLALAGRRVTLKDVQAYALPTEDAKLWTMAAAVHAGDAEKALRMSAELGDAIGPLIWLAGDAQIIWELRNGARANDYAAATGQNFWRIKNLFGVGKDRTRKELKERVDVTMAALERSVTGRREPEQALEEVIVRLAGKRG